MISLRVGQLVTFTTESRKERVLWIDRTGDGYYMIDVEDAAASPVFRKKADLDQLFINGLLKEGGDDPWLAPVREDEIPTVHQARRDKAWEMIRPLLAEQPALFLPEKRGQIIIRVVIETGASRHSLYRLLRQYWQRGMTPNALLPDYDRCGGRGKVKAVSDRKRGRPTNSGIDGLNIDVDMRTLFKAVVTRHFAVNRRLDVSGCHAELLHDHFTDDAIDERTGQQIPILRNPHPSLRQFRYWLEKDNDIFQLERRRRTPRVYDKDMRALLNTSTSEVFGPGSRYQIDATIADIYLVSRLNPSRIVGRPVLYVVIDVFSRMIVGIYVGFEGPSWVGAMMAITNAASDKVAYCRQFGIDITEADWPCRHLPDALLGDRGEMLGAAVETLINNFHVRVENTAPYRADWKGIVEQRFRLLPAVFKSYTPGFVEPDFRERGAHDYRLDGRLNVDDFTAIIIACVLYYNNDHRLNGYPRDAQMIADDVNPIPVELWEWGIARRSGLLRSYPEELVRLSVLPSDEATVTAQGIHFYGCYYTCREAVTSHWFEKARQKGTWKVRVSYDPRCMDEVHLHADKGRSRFLTCVLTERSAAYRDRTLWEIDQIRKEEQVRKNAHAPRSTQGRISAIRTVKEIVARAEQRHTDQPPDKTSDHRRVTGIRANRREERRDLQAREVFRSPGQEKPPGAGKVVPFPTGTPTDEDYALPSMPDIMRLIEQDGDDDDGQQ
ncbi:Mu transposase C-terminal domain-containing protein [Azospirillum palustre]